LVKKSSKLVEPGDQVITNWPCQTRSRIQLKRMSMALDRRRSTVLLANPSAHLLSTDRGVCGLRIPHVRQSLAEDSGLARVEKDESVFSFCDGGAHCVDSDRCLINGAVNKYISALAQKECTTSAGRGFWLRVVGSVALAV
jgi:hypothetical protein